MGAWSECTICVCVWGGLARVYHLCMGEGPGTSVPLVCVWGGAGTSVRLVCVGGGAGTSVPLVCVWGGVSHVHTTASLLQWQGDSFACVAFMMFWLRS